MVHYTRLSTNGFLQGNNGQQTESTAYNIFSIKEITRIFAIVYSLATIGLSISTMVISFGKEGCINFHENPNTGSAMTLLFLSFILGLIGTVIMAYDMYLSFYGQKHVDMIPFWIEVILIGFALILGIVCAFMAPSVYTTLRTAPGTPPPSTCSDLANTLIMASGIMWAVWSVVYTVARKM